MYPEQIREGLRPWQPKKLYYTSSSLRRRRVKAVRGEVVVAALGEVTRTAASGPATSPAPAAPLPKLARVNTTAYDPLLGRTYAEIGADARSNHKCQGMTGLPALPGVAGGRGGPNDCWLSAHGERDPRANGKDETSLFEGVDTSLSALAQFAGPDPPVALKAGIAAVVIEAKRAQHAFDDGNDAGTAAPIEAGLAAVRALARASLPHFALSDSARYEIDFRLKIKERDYEDAVLVSHGLTFDAVADDGLVIRRAAGETFAGGSEPGSV